MKTTHGTAALLVRALCRCCGKSRSADDEKKEDDWPAEGDDGQPVEPGQGKLLLERYRLQDGEALGQGGWCVVRLAKDEAQKAESFVAVKSFRAQNVREVGEEALSQRFVREVDTFRQLGLCTAGGSSSSSSGCNKKEEAASYGLPDPRLLFVNLLDYTRTPSGIPGKAGGQYFTVLDLAQDNLESWLKQRRKKQDWISMSEFLKVAAALAAALAWLHRLKLLHLDIKPANICLFQGDEPTWKVIDIEGAQEITAEAVLDKDCFTPLYACPEIAALAQEPGKEVRMALDPTVDVWSAGVVMLDVLAHRSVFEETWAGFQAEALMSFDDTEADPLVAWYGWLADATPVDMKSFVTEPAASVAMLEVARPWLEGLLKKDPKQRFSAQEFLNAARAAQDAEVEEAKIKMPVNAPAEVTGSENVPSSAKPEPKPAKPPQAKKASKSNISKVSPEPGVAKAAESSQAVNQQPGTATVTAPKKAAAAKKGATATSPPSPAPKKSQGLAPKEAADKENAAPPSKKDNAGKQAKEAASTQAQAAASKSLAQATPKAAASAKPSAAAKAPAAKAKPEAKKEARAGNKSSGLQKN
eukprot:TRINITY_DN5486_c0_g1_i2.p1 TRINITY_DN5486_c0_g1~~TRINITY_DN5486_c0_g1_i2.p1  ORF type:complete len:585 (-),score=197.08 TRINITY_DN5486_c0_g1_i2:221-1975(-)